jgi:hypothetical protein
MLHVIIPTSALAAFLFAQVAPRPDLRVIVHPRPRRRPWRTLLRAIEASLLPWLPLSLSLDRGYLRQLRAIAPDDTVLFFAIENLKDLQLSAKFIRTPRRQQWLWNPVASFRPSPRSQRAYQRGLRRAVIHTSTFDPDDAQRLGFQLRDQVYCQSTEPTDPGAGPANMDVCFVGADKGRLAELTRWQQRLASAGLRTQFHVVRDKRQSYDAAGLAATTEQPLSYTEYLALAGRASALLELLQARQSGPTLRGLEAAFLDKKLITNNLAMRHSPLYRPDRVFLIGEDDPQGLPDFLRRPHQALPPELLARYDINHWLRQWLP